MVGNKCDLKDERAVEYREGEELAKTWGCPFFETSAKIKLNNEGYNLYVYHFGVRFFLSVYISACFFELVKEIRRQSKPVGQPVQKKKKGGCILL